MTESSIASMREEIARTYNVIRPYIRRTPVVDVNAADFGLDPIPLALKLEMMQHTGSFKTRGAFSNLLTRAVPAAGVVAASGGNHGVAVAYAAKQAGKAARIFVPVRCFSREDGPDPFLRRRVGGGWRTLQRRADCK